MTNPDQSEGDRARDEVLAGEYVLGVLSAEKRQQVEQRLRRDRAFAAIVARWEENLSPMDDAYEPHAPSAFVLPSIEKRLFGASASVSRASLWGTLWSSAPLWRTLAFGSFILLVCTITFGLQPPSLSGKPKVLLQARLQGQNDNVFSLVADYAPDSGTLRMMPVASSVPEPKSLELWMIRGQEPPVSLGVLPQTGQGEIIVPDPLRQQLVGGVTLAVSLEPEGGSPKSTPTGPVVAAGKIPTP